MTTGNKKILIIDDDVDMIEIVAQQIEFLGFEWESARDGLEGLNMARTGDYALVVLDLGLPKLGGWEVLREVREEKKALPILILTGESDESNAVVTLELGADEYIRKPFKALEFKARVRALLRRAELGSSSVATDEQESVQKPEIIHFKDIEINQKMCRASVGDTPIPLTATEFELLVLLANNQDRVLARDQISNALWGNTSYSSEQNVKTAIARLRAKLKSEGKKGPYVKTIRGFGYRLTDESE